VLRFRYHRAIRRSAASGISPGHLTARRAPRRLLERFLRRSLRQILIRVMVVCVRVIQLFGVGGGAVAASAFIVLVVAGLLVAVPDGRSSPQP